MTQLHIVISHNLEYKEVLKRVKELIKELKGKHGESISHARQSWKGGVGFFGFSIRGIEMQGVIVVSVESIIITGDLPWQTKLFRRQIESAIRRQTHSLLRAKPRKK